MAVNTGVVGQQLCHSPFNDETLVCFKLTLDGASATLDYRAKRYLSAVAEAATGEYTLTFKKRWAGIFPVGQGVNVIGDNDVMGKVIAITDGGAAANVVTIQTHTGSTGADVDPGGANVYVSLLLSLDKPAI